MNKQNWNNMTVAILGGAGCIGSRLAQQLAGRVKKLYIVDGFVEKTGANAFNLSFLPKGSAEIVRGNLQNIAPWGSLLRACDVIFNFASVNAHKESMKEPFKDLTINATPHLHLALFCQTIPHPVKIVFASSRSVYGKVKKNPVSEKILPMPLDFYSVHTLLVEHYYRICCNQNVSVTCARFSNVFGPGQRLKGNDIGLWGELLRSALLNEPMAVYGNGEVMRDTLWIDDLAQALLLLALDKTKGFQIINVGGVPVPIKRFAECIQLVMPKARVVEMPMPKSLQSIQVGSVVLDGRQMQKKFGWRPKSELRETIYKTLKFFQRYHNHYL
jgi:UDP-glucose 4-epimerase